jgi:hypothetical protein
MPTVFQAANALEAHLIADLLARSHIDARIEGEFLAGGIGDLPVVGLIRVVVNEEDVEVARSLIAQWESGAFAIGEDELP